MFTLIGIGRVAFCLVSLDCFFQMFSPEFKTEMGTVHLYFEATTVILTLVLWGNY
jgi:Cu2+-exporting ATPase